MQSCRLAMFLCSVSMCFGVQLSATPIERPGEIELEKRSFKTAAGKVVNYELGTLYVSENRSDPNSRVIGIGFARFRCKNSLPTAPALFILPGGPGSSYIENLGKSRRVRNSLERFSPFCDIVFVDQRGFSTHGDVLLSTINVPKRPKDHEISRVDNLAAFKSFAAETASRYAKGETDLRGYTVKECAHDVADLSKALGYEQIMLNGTSFGSQWSFAVMRLHPEIVARAILSGVEPLDHAYDMPSYVLAAVQRMWRTIDEDDRFKPYLPPGGMAEAARVVIERLEQQPIVFYGPANSNGEKEKTGVFGSLDFPWNKPTEIIELYHGHTERWERRAKNGFKPGRQEVSLIGPLFDSSIGVTPERRHRMWHDPATRYLGRGNFAGYLATASIWPSPDVGDDFRIPILCDIPVVFAQGDWDTSTPLENTFEIAAFFVNSRVIIAERGGHGVLDSIAQQHPDVGSALDEFLRTGKMSGIPARVRLKPSRNFTTPRFDLEKAED